MEALARWWYYEPAGTICSHSLTSIYCIIHYIIVIIDPGIGTWYYHAPSQHISYIDPGNSQCLKERLVFRPRSVVESHPMKISTMLPIGHCLILSACSTFISEGQGLQPKRMINSGCTTCFFYPWHIDWKFAYLGGFIGGFHGKISLGLYWHVMTFTDDIRSYMFPRGSCFVVWCTVYSYHSLHLITILLAD